MRRSKSLAREPNRRRRSADERSVASNASHFSSPPKAHGRVRVALDHVKATPESPGRPAVPGASAKVEAELAKLRKGWEAAEHRGRREKGASLHRKHAHGTRAREEEVVSGVDRRGYGAEEAELSEPINVLLVRPCDVRHVLKTVAQRRRLRRRPLHIYLYETPNEVLARDLLLLQLVHDWELPIRHRAKTAALRAPWRAGLEACTVLRLQCCFGRACNWRLRRPPTHTSAFTQARPPWL